MNSKTDINIDIGKAIEKGIEKKALSQAKLSQLLGVSRGAVSLWIKNKRTPSGHELIRLAIILDIVEDLFPEKKIQEYKNVGWRTEIAEMRKRLDEIEKHMESSSSE